MSKKEKLEDKEIDSLIKELDVSFSKSKDNTTINFDLKTKDFTKLNRLVNQIQKKDIKVVVARNDLTTL